MKGQWYRVERVLGTCWRTHRRRHRKTFKINDKINVNDGFEQVWKIVAFSVQSLIFFRKPCNNV